MKKIFILAILMLAYSIQLYAQCPQPAATESSFSPASISGGNGSSTLSLTTSSTTPAGTYSITITGVSGAITHSVTIQLTVGSSTPPGGGGGGGGGGGCRGCNPV